jgi:hypothetical protein
MIKRFEQFRKQWNKIWDKEDAILSGIIGPTPEAANRLRRTGRNIRGLCLLANAAFIAMTVKEHPDDFVPQGALAYGMIGVAVLNGIGIALTTTGGHRFANCKRQEQTDILAPKSIPLEDAPPVPSEAALQITSYLTNATGFAGTALGIVAVASLQSGTLTNAGGIMILATRVQTCFNGACLLATHHWRERVLDKKLELCNAAAATV